MEQLVRRYPNYAPAHEKLALLYLSLGQNRPALEELERCLELNPLQPNIQELAGNRAMELKLYERAEFHYRHWLGQQPKLVKPRLMLALALTEQNQFDAAQKILLQTLQLDSSSHQAYAMLSDIFARQNKLPLALGQIDKALQQVPKDNRTYVLQYTRTKARLLLRDNRGMEALQTLRTLPGKEQMDIAIMDDMATCLAMTNQPELAAMMFERHSHIDPTDDRVVARAAHWYIQAHDKTHAQAMIEQLRRLDPQASEISSLEERCRKLR
jgi:predicted Zn-dependent protease